MNHFNHIVFNYVHSLCGTSIQMYGYFLLHSAKHCIIFPLCVKIQATAATISSVCPWEVCALPSEHCHIKRDSSGGLMNVEQAQYPRGLCKAFMGTLKNKWHFFHSMLLGDKRERKEKATVGLGFRTVLPSQLDCEGDSDYDGASSAAKCLPLETHC